MNALLAMQIKSAVLALFVAGVFPPGVVTTGKTLTSRAYELELFYDIPGIDWHKVVEAHAAPSGTPPVGYSGRLRDDLTPTEIAVFMNGLCWLTELLQVVPEYTQLTPFCETIISVDDVYSVSRWSFIDPVGAGGVPPGVYLLHKRHQVVSPRASIRKVTLIGLAEGLMGDTSEGIYSLNIPIDKERVGPIRTQVTDSVSAERLATAAARACELLTETLEYETARTVFFVASGQPSWIVWFRFKDDVETYSVDGARSAWHLGRHVTNCSEDVCSSNEFPVLVRSDGLTIVGERLSVFELHGNRIKSSTK